jgi:AcrR family transcriptional regulator
MWYKFSMREDIPIPGSNKAKLIAVGLQKFSQYSYDEVDVDSVEAEAGVTIGSLYHHFQSKKAFYGVLRDDMTRRILDRMEAASESVAPEHALKAALLAAYDGVLRIKAGKLLTEPDPRGGNDPIAGFLGELAARNAMLAPAMLGILLAAALRAALTQALAGHAEARQALEALLTPSEKMWGIQTYDALEKELNS